jgi:hypothetical protein
MKALDLITGNLKWIAIIVIVLLGLAQLKSCSDKDSLAQELALIKQKEQTAANNIKVMQDSMEYWVDKSGNYKSEISILSADKETLEKDFGKFKNKFNEVVGKDYKNQEMIAYLENQIKFKDEVIAGLNSDGPYSLANDSTIAINVHKQYDSLNYYKITGSVVTTIKDNKIKDGTVNLSPEFGISLALAMAKDKDGIVHITSSTRFPAQVQMSGINTIERHLNQSYSGYLGLGISTGYGFTLQQQTQAVPFIGLSLTYMPSWLTIKLGKKYK